MTLGRLGGCWPKRVSQVEAKPFTRCSCSRKSDLVTVFVLLVVFGPANEPLGGLLHLRQRGGHTLHSLRMTTCLSLLALAGLLAPAGLLTPWSLVVLVTIFFQIFLDGNLNCDSVNEY